MGGQARLRRDYHAPAGSRADVQAQNDGALREAAAHGNGTAEALLLAAGAVRRDQSGAALANENA